MRQIYTFYSFKGTLIVVLSDPPCKDGNARFTTVPLKPLSDQRCGSIVVFLDLKVFKSDNSDMSFYSRYEQATCIMKPQLKIISF